MPTADTQQSIHALYSNHHGWLRGWLQKKLGCPQRAGDLAHDTFERVLTRADIAGINEPRPWLLTIAKRLLIDRSRRQQLEQAYLDECRALMDSAPSLAPSAEQIQIALQALECIARALQPLPENARRAFVMRHVDDLTLVEIATELNVSHTMVRKYLAQCLVACDALLADNGGVTE